MIALLRRLKPRPRSTAVALPFVWQNEDGETFWAVGHVEPAEFLLGLIAEHLLLVGSEETVEVLFGCDLLLARAGHSEARLHMGDLLAGVSHGWIDRDEAEREIAQHVTASHPAAMAVTWLDVRW